jgi:SanA protein
MEKPSRRRPGGGKRIKRVMMMVTVALVLLVLVVAYSNYHIHTETRGRIHADADALPHNRVGLVLGTSKYLTAGGINPYFSHRIEAAVRLYRLGKVDYLLASGDNSKASYNEPKFIHRELLERGVPDDRIYLDYAGFRTLDSVVRCKEVFGQDSFTVVSQSFHAERALFIADNYGIDAVGYAARGVPRSRGLKVMIREVFAKAVAVFDVYIFHTEPKFLGEKISIP